MEFFQAVRSLNLRAQAAGKGDRPLGSDTPYSQEPVHFSVQNTLGFPATAVSQLTPPEQADEPHKMQVTFMGLTGPMGVLPDHYTELVIARLHAKDTALADFFDLFFNHRAISLYYRAWEKYRLYLSAEKTHDRTLEALLMCLIGYGMPGVQNRLSIPDQTFISYAGLFVQRPHCAINLEMMLEDYLRVPVEIQQFQGRWVHVAPGNLGQLRDPHGRGEFANSPHPVARLGVNMMLGNRAWSEETKIRLRIGPLTQHQFNLLLPGGPQALALAELTRSFIGRHLHFDAQYLLYGEEVPIWKLRADDGYDIFLMSVDKKPSADALKKFQKTHFPLLMREKTGTTWMYGATSYSPAQVTELDTTHIKEQLDALHFPPEPEMLAYSEMPIALRDAIKAQGAHLHFPPRLGRNIFLYSTPPTGIVEGPVFSEETLREYERENSGGTA